MREKDVTVCHDIRFIKSKPVDADKIDYLPDYCSLGKWVSTVKVGEIINVVSLCA